MRRDPVSRIRHFNRTITRRIGALDDSFLGAGISLGSARVLYEIKTGATEVRSLRARLGLDSGHMSRLLRTLERRRLIATSPDPADARVRVAHLTSAGRTKLRELERKTSEGARSWLAPLSRGQQIALQEAMDEVVRLLTASEVTIRLEDPRAKTSQWCLAQFARELDARFDTGFDLGRAASAGPEEVSPPNGAFLVAALPDRPVGCIALKLDARRRIGEVKRMWVSPDVRRLGLGRRLLEAVEAQARRFGVARLRLSTNRTLVEAQALYRANGYARTRLFDDEPYAHMAFEKRLR